MDTRLGSLSVHLDTPQCFSAEMYSQELNIVGKPEDDKVNECILISNLHTRLFEFIFILVFSLLPTCLWHVSIGRNKFI